MFLSLLEIRDILLVIGVSRVRKWIGFKIDLYFFFIILSLRQFPFPPNFLQSSSAPPVSSPDLPNKQPIHFVCTHIKAQTLVVLVPVFQSSISQAPCILALHFFVVGGICFLILVGCTLTDDNDEDKEEGVASVYITTASLVFNPWGSPDSPDPQH